MNDQFGELRSALERRAWSEVDAILADWTPERLDDALVYARAKKWKEPEVRSLEFASELIRSAGLSFEDASAAFEQFNRSMQTFEREVARTVIPAMQSLVAGFAAVGRAMGDASRLLAEHERQYAAVTGANKE
jgi:hypothetical protein